MQLIQAINVTLSALGESEIMSLSTSNPSAGVARSAIERHTAMLLATGWWFNTVDVVVQAPQSGKIKVPASSISVIDTERKQLYGIRDGLLYNIATSSTVFTGIVKYQARLGLEFEDLPEYAAQYIAYSAAAEVYQNDLGADTNVQRLEAQAQEAYRLMHMEQVRVQSMNTRRTRQGYRLGRSIRL
ncbi:tail tubular protein A [Providencia phage vB_PstP_PS3]|uniref:Tail tubular protein A n=1 Tax=Providencia phage vB_PstP_PS3 TaxID=2848038 RepID=A0A411AWC0_9CAUD|nr:tail protein [Providencia phage vB_PstP_PS3]QAX92403.1 tail tubular protein A [Providencia phage vB_PstP_PS3]